MWEKGQPSANPYGRPKGSKSKQSEAIRKAYADLIENNLENITLWLEKLAKNDPAKAIDALIKLSNFVVPKLSETDVTSGGEKINIVLPPRPEQDEDGASS